MKPWTHRTVAGGLATLAWSPFAGDLLSLALVGILAAGVSTVPDWVDFKISKVAEHRNVATHGLPSLAFPTAGTALALAALLPHPLAAGISVALWAGWGSHLLLDALTHSGIPRGDHHWSLHWTRYDDPPKNLLLVGLGCTCWLFGFLVSAATRH
ncbi:MAG: metal-dependent hydrolase [Promethearchaeota archaeon]